MRLKLIQTLWVIALLIGVLTGCAPSIEEVSAETKTLVGQSFSETPFEGNKTQKSFSYHLPEGMVIESEEENNVILQKEEQLYILFVNSNEETDSDVMYQSINTETSSEIINETFVDDDRFGYVRVTELEKDVFEVSVGIGGAKMTTECKLKEVSENAEQMMDIVASIAY
jgi:hypothetical protein